ncbi:MAG: permease prefix domain 1-containing protein [Lachnospiraceae bacterium]|nr:permease prefix domain 1-containing protein [Lachnospiraceae bacterium]
METIRNYLETMFAKLPVTFEVQKAKNELWQIMEDKYTELLQEGKTENEAVGIVISEFGNLDELAEELGISNVVLQGNQKLAGNLRHVTLEEVKDYLHDKTRAAYTVALGVLLCIISCCGYLLEISWSWRGGVYAMCFMFLAIAAAVGLFLFSGFVMGRWKFLKQRGCSVDFATAEYVHNRRESFRVTYAMMITIGVILCILSVLPVLIVTSLFSWGSGMGPALMFVFIGVGVFLFVAAGNVNAGFTTILSLNKNDTMGGIFVPSQKQVSYKNDTVSQMMSVYWPTVTCIYLCWSFLSFDWHITWIVWVIAAVVQRLIRTIW